MSFTSVLGALDYPVAQKNPD